MSASPVNKPARTNTPEQGVKAALNHLANDPALLGIHRVSAFNLHVGVNALLSNAGGELVIKIPTKAGDVAEVTYRGLETRR